jgi:hypothetical protein
LEKQRERKHLDDVGVDGKDNIKMDLLDVGQGDVD